MSLKWPLYIHSMANPDNWEPQSCVMCLANLLLTNMAKLILLWKIADLYFWLTWHSTTIAIPATYSHVSLTWLGCHWSKQNWQYLVVSCGWYSEHSSSSFSIKKRYLNKKSHIKVLILLHWNRLSIKRSFSCHVILDKMVHYSQEIAIKRKGNLTPVSNRCILLTRKDNSPIIWQDLEINNLKCIWDKHALT